VTNALARIPVGVIVERRKAKSPWIDFTWKPVAVLAGEPEASPWTRLSEDADAATFYAGASEIELHRTETANYRDNIASGAPSLWVALRPTGADPPYALFAVTADPGEGEAWTASDGTLVEAVPMPDAVRSELDRFIAEHHVERPFFKRERNRGNPDELAHRDPMRKGLK
jgi:Protein of unknown function (DUF3305)